MSMATIAEIKTPSLESSKDSRHPLSGTTQSATLKRNLIQLIARLFTSAPSHQYSLQMTCSYQ